MTNKELPTFEEIKAKLKPVSPWEKWAVVVVPLATIGAYFTFTLAGFYVPAFLCLIYLSFATYGSCSHDLVHANVGFSRKASNIWLSVIEFLLMRSGTTYRKTHLNHHQHYPHFENDPEGRASYYSLFRTLCEGPVFHPKLVLWMLKNGNEQDRFWVKIEVVAVISFYVLGIALWKSFPELLAYQVIVTMGAWVIPLITSYLVHVPQGESPLLQTKVFRGQFFRLLALDHLYHLEHHLYAQVPHCRWKDLAVILNPYFEQKNLNVVRWGRMTSQKFDLN